MSEPLPVLHAGELDAATLAALFDDLETHAEVLDVLVKAGAGAHADTTPVPLREAQRRLGSGELRGIQIRYRYGGAEWRDTLLRSGNGVRVVRMEMPRVNG